MQHAIEGLNHHYHVLGPCMASEDGFRRKRAFHKAGRDRVLKFSVLAGPDR